MLMTWKTQTTEFVILGSAFLEKLNSHLAIQVLILLQLCFLCFLGNAQTIVHSESFATGLGTWNQVSISDATDTWSVSSGYAEINGFGGGDDEDWLISPSINLSSQNAEYLLFDYNDNFNGNQLELYYSTNYNGGNTILDVQSATWQPLNDRLINIATTSCFTTLFQRHPAIDISSISGTNVYFAFKYTGTSSSSKRYYIDNVRILADYYAPILSSLSCCNLKTALHNLIRNQTDNIRYTSSNYDVWDAMLQTDVRMNDPLTDTIMWDMFTDFPTTTGEFEFDPCSSRDQGSCPGGEGQCYNREHSFPKSWWGGGTTTSDSAYTDMHHLVPSDRSLNSAKSNFPPGVVLSPTTTGTNGFMVGNNNTYPCGASMKYFEPIDEYKGDYARIYFFMITRYESNLTTWAPLSLQGDCALDGTACPGLEPWLLNLLLSWHFNDPVSQKEIDRNNAVYAIQGNRNPFIDSPNWVNLIWGDHLGNTCSSIALPVELNNFSGEVHGERAILEWETLSEHQNDFFEVLKSRDGNYWHSIGKVNGKGNSIHSSKYNFVDDQITKGDNYYRLKQVDFNGDYTFSPALVLYHNNNRLLYPNPASNTIILEPSVITNASSIFMVNINGRVVLKINAELDKPINISSLDAGLYFVNIYTKTKEHHIERLIIE